MTNSKPLADHLFPGNHTSQAVSTARITSLVSGHTPSHLLPRCYNYTWFHTMILLIYLLAVAIAVDLLYTFPLSQQWALFETPRFGLVVYVIWVLLDLGLVWTFAFACLSLQDGDHGLSLHLKKSIFTRLIPRSETWLKAVKADL